MKKLHYIALPYSSKDEKVIEHRINKFCELDSKLNMQGIQTVSPVLKHLLFTNHKEMPRDWEFWKDLSYILLSKSDFLVVFKLEGWEESVGVKAEIIYAHNNNIPVIYIEEDLSNLEEKILLMKQ